MREFDAAVVDVGHQLDSGIQAFPSHRAGISQHRGLGHMKVDTFGKKFFHTLHIAFKANRLRAEAPRSSKESCFGN
ncbi:hypothetical protein C2W62_24590, partial [Candidatus Entotheonella serta]